MTLKQFFQKARRGRKWSVNHWDKVRDQNDYCPLASVGRGHGWNPSYIAKQIGLRDATAWKIALAADSSRGPYRPWLLKHLGVSV